MIKANVTVVKDSTGKLSVLCLSEDADEAIRAFKAYDGDGEVSVFRLSVAEKNKKSGVAAYKAVTQAPSSEPEPAEAPEADPASELDEEPEAVAKKRGRPRKV